MIFRINTNTVVSKIMIYFIILHNKNFLPVGGNRRCHFETLGIYWNKAGWDTRILTLNDIPRTENNQK